MERAKVGETYNFLANVAIACLLAGTALITVGFTITSGSPYSIVYKLLGVVFIFIFAIGLLRVKSYYFPDGPSAFWRKQILNSKPAKKIKKKKSHFGGFVIISIELLIGIAALGTIWQILIIPNVVQIAGTDTSILQSYLQTLLTFGSIFIPLGFLVLFELSKQEQWKKISHNRLFLKLLAFAMFCCAIFIFIAISLGAVNSPSTLESAIKYAYSGVGIALMTVIASVLLYVELYR